MPGNFSYNGAPPLHSRPGAMPAQAAGGGSYGNPHIGGKGLRGGPWSWGNLAQKVGGSWNQQQGMSPRPQSGMIGGGGSGSAPAPSLPSFDTLLALGGRRPMQKPFGSMGGF